MKSHSVRALAPLLLALLVLAAPLRARELDCAPCVGLSAAEPSAVADALAVDGALVAPATLQVAWTAELDGSADPTELAAIREVGASPWIRAVVRTPQPVAEHLPELEGELRELVALARAAGPEPVLQIVWDPAGGAREIADLAFVLKRAAVAVTGAVVDATFVGGPLRADPEWLRALYAEEVAAYLDVLALAPSDALTAAMAVLAELDPGKPIAIDALAWPADPELTLVQAASATAVGAALVFFSVELDARPDLRPIRTLAEVFSGDVEYAEGQSPDGGRGAWAFVRGEDLGLRVVAEPEPGSDRLRLDFYDRLLRRPVRIDPVSRAESFVPGRSVTTGLAVEVREPGAAVLLRLDRPTVQELQGVQEQVEVADERVMPVEEILRRLQAFEDAQARRLSHYVARNTMHLRFQNGRGSLEASYAGPLYYSREDGFDWVWEEFFVDGVRWRSKSLPEIPLIQPEKVATTPLEIRFTPSYSYRLRGTARVEDRECWVVDFKPLVVAPGDTLYQGTVWVDREVFARVRTRATQIGLEGDVLSNEETISFAPLDVDGRSVPWSSEAFVLPVRNVGEQTLSLLDATVPVEREFVLTDVRINAAGFDESRQAAWESDRTMVRDTDDGLRYLRKDDSGQRVVETEYDTSRLFLLGGVFWDESLDFPLPLAGVNYLDLDFRDTGGQLNVFFAGAFANVNLSKPGLFGSRWNLGGNVSAFFFERGDELFRDGEEVEAEEVESRDASAALFLGRPIGEFFKLDLTLRARYDTYSDGDDTDPSFVLPQDSLTQTFLAELVYNRSGYRARLAGSVHRRSDWEFWGLPDNTEFDPDQEEYTRWEVSLGKTWWLSNFRNFGLSVEHLNGSHLDRFSRYDFGLFGDSSVAGYQGGLVRADEATGVHLGYGINVLDRIRFELEGDAVWATSQETGLEDELLAGVGLEGTWTLPWGIVTNFEVGVGVDGPGRGDVAARVFFLKLFKQK